MLLGAFCKCCLWLWPSLRLTIFGKPVPSDEEIGLPDGSDGNTKSEAALARLVQIYNLSPQELLQTIHGALDVHTRTQRVAVVVGAHSYDFRALSAVNISPGYLRLRLRLYLSGPNSSSLVAAGTPRRRDADLIPHKVYSSPTSLLIQTPRGRTVRELIQKLAIDARMFDSGKKSSAIHRRPTPPCSQQSSHLWWRLYRSHTDVALTQFSASGDTSSPSLLFHCLNPRDVALELGQGSAIGLQTLGFSNCRMLVFSSGVNIPKAIEADAWHRKHLLPAERWYFRIRYPGWHWVALMYGVLLAAVTWFWRSWLGVLYAGLDKEILDEPFDAFEPTSLVEGMLSQPIQWEGRLIQMSLFRFSLRWLCEPRNGHLLEVMRRTRMNPLTTAAETRLSERGLCARLKFTAWTVALGALQEAAQSLRVSAIDDPRLDTLKLLNTCRLLAATLETQLQRNKRQALDDVEALEWNEEIERKCATLDQRFNALYPPRQLQRSQSTIGMRQVLRGETSKSAGRRRSLPDLQLHLELENPDALHISNISYLADTQMDRGQVLACLIEPCPQISPQPSNDDDNTFLTSTNLSVRYDALTTDLKDLKVGLSETFQHLGLSIQLKDAAISKKQAGRATALAVIATIYLPATLVVGIFGMNIEGLGGDVSAKWPAIVFAAMFTPSALALLILFLRE